MNEIDEKKGKRKKEKRAICYGVGTGAIATD
jgi:hypothetical protein